MKQAIARAHTNIALIKYWGKKNQELILPQNNSLSLTLDRFYTDTEVVFDENFNQDSAQINRQEVTGSELDKLNHFMQIVRMKANIDIPYQIRSINHVPTAAGLASSASAYAALAAAAARAAGLNLNKTELSKLARRGSGSACRSIFGGFAEWQQGIDDDTSFAVPINETVDWDIQMIAIILDDRKKSVSSRLGMQQVVDTSPYYPAWVVTATEDLAQMKEAIIKKDINLVGTIAQENAMRMHATTLSAKPPFTYFQPSTLEVITAIDNLRNQGFSCYYTIDAGPNVKVICPQSQTPEILDRLRQFIPTDHLLVAKPGPGVTYLDQLTI